jgi:hypothetical protein
LVLFWDDEKQKPRLFGGGAFYSWFIKLSNCATSVQCWNNNDYHHQNDGTNDSDTIVLAL